MVKDSSYDLNLVRVVRKQLSPVLASKFITIYRFLLKHPGQASRKAYQSREELLKEKTIVNLAASFARGRQQWLPAVSRTIPDDAIKVVLERYFDVSKDSLDEAVTWHKYSMQAENMIGDILERYLANILEPLGWIWCAGSVVKAVDFIKPGPNYRLLQIKNRDNSENSSSAAIREGTDIKKWFRSYSKTRRTNWDVFPDKHLRSLLSESAFREYAIRYLRELRSLQQR